MFLGKDFLVDSDDESNNTPLNNTKPVQQEKPVSSTTTSYNSYKPELNKRTTNDFSNNRGKTDNNFDDSEQNYGGYQQKPSFSSNNNGSNNNPYKSPMNLNKQTSGNNNSASKRASDMNNFLYNREEDNEDISNPFDQQQQTSGGGMGARANSGAYNGNNNNNPSVGQTSTGYGSTYTNPNTNYFGGTTGTTGTNFGATGGGASNYGTSSNFFQPNDDTVKKNSVSSGVARPGSATMEQRKRMLEQQKAMLQEKNKMQLGNVTSNPMYNPALSGAYRNSDINYDHLQSIVQENKGPVYEPGMSQMKSNLPTLNKNQDNVIRAKAPENDGTEKAKPNLQPKTTQNTQASTQSNHSVKKLNTMDLSEDDSEDEEKMMDQRIKEAELIKEKTKKAKHEEKVLMSDELMQKNKSADTYQQLESAQQQPQTSSKQKPEAETKQPEKQKSDEASNNNDDNPANLKPLINIDIPDMKAFLSRPAPTNGIVQCSIKRDRSGFGRFFPKYHIYFSNGFRHLMSAKKRANNKTSNYLITMDKKDMSKKSQGFLGKLRSNFLGTEFHIYDGGMNPKKAQVSTKSREELGVILYESNLLGARGPRKMRVALPEVKKTGESIVWKPSNPKEDILNALKANKLDGLKTFTNKPPKWNEHVQAFVLNFNGRVDKPSVKNFQLIDENDDSIIYLQFGRVGDDIFNIDFQWPISPLQAFAICLSSFDYKIACE